MAADTVYDDIITELFTLFADHFPEMSEGSIQDGDLDAVIEAMSTEPGITQGCVFSFISGSPHGGDAHSNSWNYLFGGVVLIQLKDLDTIEAERRKVISRLSTFASPVKVQRLNGIVKKLEVSSIERAREGDINEHPFYFVPFSISVIFRGDS